MAAIAKKAIKISQKHLLGIQNLSISDVKYILSEAKQFISLNRSKNKKLNRSEEHTSELQSRRNLVCRLLLEKKNKISNETTER